MTPARLLFCLLLVALSCSSSDPYWTPNYREPAVRYRYSPADSAALYVWVYQPTRPKEQRAVIAFLHGGQWTTGEPEEFSAWARYFAARGATTALVEYRSPAAYYSPLTALRNVKSALRFIRREARTLQIDPDRLVVVGADAGGQLATGAATIAYYNNRYDDQRIPARPNAQVLLAPLLDLGPEQTGNALVGAAWPTFSPLHTVTRAIPPTLLLTGKNDSLVSTLTLRDYRDSVRAVNGEIAISRTEGGHQFYRQSPQREQALESIDQWLIERQFLGGRPRVRSFRFEKE